jgi:hypothetical protein
VKIRYAVPAAALFLAVTLAAPAGPSGPNRLISLLPVESNLIFLVEDIPGFLESWPTTPLGKTWNDPEVKQFLAPMRDNMELDRWEEIVLEGTGYELSEILDGFTGPAAIAVLDLQEMIEAEKTGADPPILALAEIGGDGEILRELLAADLESSREEADEGVQIEAAEEETDFWAIVDGVAVFTGSKDLLQRTVASIKEEGGADSLAARRSFQAFRTRFSPYDVMLYLNVAEFVPLVMESIGEEEAKQLEETGPPAAPNPFGITTETVFDALGLEKIHGLALSYRLGEKVTRIDMGITYEEGAGVVRFLESYRSGPVDLPAFIPENVLDASVSNFSFTMAWQAVREVLQAMSPQVGGLLDIQLAQLKAGTGIDIENSLLSSLGEQLIAASFRRPAGGLGGDTTIGEPDQLFGISLTDRQGLEMVLELAKTMAATWGFVFEEHEFLDQTIYVSRMPAAPPGEAAGDDPAAADSPQGLSYALTPDYLFISAGTTEPIRTVLSRIRKPGRSVWIRPEVRAAIEAYPGTASVISYQDFASLIMQVFEGFVAMQQLGDQSGEAPDAICDPDKLADQKVLDRYIGVAVGATVREKGGFYFTSRVHAADQ